MHTVIGCVLAVVSGAVIGAVATALMRWIFGISTSVWLGALLGAAGGVGTIVMADFERRGWLVAWPVSQLSEWRQNKKRLAEDRDRIITEARSRKK